MDGDNIEDVAYTTFNSWGIGKRGLDNGCLIVVSLAERKSRIETGKGVGGEVTDVQALNILKTKLNPHLKSGDFAGGFHATLDELGSLIESRHNKTALVVNDPVPSTSAGCTLAAAGVGADTGSGGGLFFMFLLVASALVTYKLMRRSARRKQQAIDDAEALASAELNRQRQERLNTGLRRKELERNRLAANAPVVPAPVIPSRVVPPVSSVLGAPPVPPRITRVVNPKPVTIAPPRPRPTVKAVAATAAVGVTAGALAAAAEKRMKDREDEDRRARQRRDEESRKRQRDDDDRRSSSSSYSSGSSSSDYGSSGGGGYDGGSSGGGGASSDW